MKIKLNQSLQIKKYNSDTENWMPNQMRKDAAKGFPVNPADYLNM